MPGGPVGIISFPKSWVAQAGSQCNFLGWHSKEYFGLLIDLKTILQVSGANEKAVNAGGIGVLVLNPFLLIQMHILIHV